MFICSVYARYDDKDKDRDKDPMTTIHRLRRDAHARPAVRSAGRLREEIAVIERRLAQLGPDGDCGYENAMIRFYEQQLGMRREQLAAFD